MRKNILVCLILLSLSTVLPLSIYSADSSVNLVTIEWAANGGSTINAIPSTDNSITNPDYKLLYKWYIAGYRLYVTAYQWYGTANYRINPSNVYNFSEPATIEVITNCANTWDIRTSAAIFSYTGIPSTSAGIRDGYNVVSWGSYKAETIAATFIWARGKRILETDTMMNTFFSWSISGEANKMDVQNIMTHEFGHWCGLADLYAGRDYWLTMYGNPNYGETYGRTLGFGDICGLKAVYGS